MSGAGRSKSLKNIIVDNCVFEILGTTPNKIFTSADILKELDKVYGVETSQGYLWKLLNEVLLKNALIMKRDKVGITYKYEIIDRNGITNMLDPDIKLPLKPVNHLEEPNLVFNSIEPVKVLGQDKYNMLCAKISSYGIKPVDEMVLVVAAIFNYCCKHDITEFKSSDIYRKLRMLSTNTIMTNIHMLHEKRCVVSAETGLINQDIIYKLKHKPINCGTITKDGSLIEKSKVKKIEKVKVEESPAEKISGVKLTNEEIGLGIIDYINKAEIEKNELIDRLGVLVKENAVLLEKNLELEDALNVEKDKLIALSSKHETLVKDSQTPAAEIILSNMGNSKRFKA